MLGSTCNLAASVRLLLPFLLAVLFCNCTGESLNASQVEQNENAVDCIFPPNDHDLFVLFSKPENAGRTGELFVGVVNEQNPMISKESLLRLVEARQHSISDFRTKYTVFEEEFGDGSNFGVSRKTSYEYAGSGNKIYFAYEYPDGDDNRESAGIRSYDGERIISLFTYHDGNLHAGIQEPDTGVLMGFFRVSMPLSLAKLFDTRLCGFSGVEGNLMLFLQSDRLYGIFEKKEMVDGRECIVVADLMSRFYLDPQRDFSVVQSEGYRLELSDTGHIVGRWLGSRSKLFDIRDQGNGVWIPYRAIMESFDSSGNITSRSIVDVSFVEINKGLDDDFFTGFIPDDTPVADATTGLAYLYGERLGFLQEVVKSNRAWFLQYISLTVGCILILLVVIVKYIKYFKRKRAGL